MKWEYHRHFSSFGFVCVLHGKEAQECRNERAVSTALRTGTTTLNAWQKTQGMVGLAQGKRAMTLNIIYYFISAVGNRNCQQMLMTIDFKTVREQ